jgi:hypothetical protein
VYMMVILWWVLQDFVITLTLHWINLYQWRILRWKRDTIDILKGFSIFSIKSWWNVKSVSREVIDPYKRKRQLDLGCWLVGKMKGSSDYKHILYISSAGSLDGRSHSAWSVIERKQKSFNILGLNILKDRDVIIWHGEGLDWNMFGHEEIRIHLM